MNVSELIDKRISELSDWRGGMLARLRKVIANASPDLVEEWKWDSPVWSYNGNVLSIGAFQDHVKINFFHGALLKDHHELFNAGLEAKASRGIDLFEGDTFDEAALTELIRAAVALNAPKSKAAKPTKKSPSMKKSKMAKR